MCFSRNVSSILQCHFVGGRLAVNLSTASVESDAAPQPYDLPLSQTVRKSGVFIAGVPMGYPDTHGFCHSTWCCGSSMRPASNRLALFLSCEGRSPSPPNQIGLGADTGHGTPIQTINQLVLRPGQGFSLFFSQSHMVPTCCALPVCLLMCSLFPVNLRY